MAMFHSCVKLQEGTHLFQVIFPPQPPVGPRPFKLPQLPCGLRYLAIAAGHRHSLLLRSDGRVMAMGDDGRLEKFLGEN